tara:strand:- start:23353 stop:24354 length:1002 start_codon:yes stop_codon:yes gene_type:complete
MIQIKKKSIVYVQAPSHYFSGGPLALHQLAYKLRKMSINAVMYYNPKVKDNPVNTNFKKYKLPYVFEIADNSENVLIISEFNTSIIFKFKNIKKAIWWLSIDNYFKGHEFLKKSIKNKFLSFFKMFNFFDLNNSEQLNLDIFHLAQSKYAYTYLKNKKIKNLNYLHCYLDEKFNNISYDLNSKQDIVAYNPKKGIKFTKEIIKRFHNSKIKFVPVQNMSISEVQELLLKSKIYIDFGNHPGRDRFPREAALFGCSIITNKKGSAKNKLDVNIPEEYKFQDESELEFNKIIDLIKEITVNFRLHHDNFNSYRNTILNDEKRFDLELKKVFFKNE